MKDMPTLQPEGLILNCYLARADVRDAFVSPKYASIRDLPQGATVGSSSLRRRSWRWCALICGWSSFVAMCRPVCASCKGWRMQPS